MVQTSIIYSFQATKSFLVLGRGFLRKGLLQILSCYLQIFPLKTGQDIFFISFSLFSFQPKRVLKSGDCQQLLFVSRYSTASMDPWHTTTKLQNPIISITAIGYTVYAASGLVQDKLRFMSLTASFTTKLRFSQTFHIIISNYRSDLGSG